MGVLAGGDPASVELPATDPPRAGKRAGVQFKLISLHLKFIEISYY